MRRFVVAGFVAVVVGLLFVTPAAAQDGPVPEVPAATHLIYKATFSPDTPNILRTGSANAVSVTVNFITVGSGVKMFAVPMTGSGATSGGVALTTVKPCCSGSAVLKFYLNSPAKVDGVYLRMVRNDGSNTVLFTATVPVHYQFK